MPRNAELVALLNEAAEIADRFYTDNPMLRSSLATRLRTAADALAGDDWTPSGTEYDRAIHHNPDAKAWADLFVETYPALADKHDVMLGWFANAMMAMYDHLASKQRADALAGDSVADAERAVLSAFAEPRLRASLDTLKSTLTDAARAAQEDTV